MLFTSVSSAQWCRPTAEARGRLPLTGPTGPARPITPRSRGRVLQGPDKARKLSSARQRDPVAWHLDSQSWSHRSPAAVPWPVGSSPGAAKASQLRRPLSALSSQHSGLGHLAGDKGSISSEVPCLVWFKRDTRALLRFSCVFSGGQGVP